ncbi:hypothetical protein [Salisediminibacterium halotolerans]|uniref:hypothetical protein n=1 Tax=Salisediminibacterium halotolerans TaxID=517425 RepID=UPI000EAFFD15|nr:hypothetical protein [Salisediminibacterium halotolerans]RLJ75486.1 hypothetical protein BCL39_1001 [Actinophytocola xinjiangensis]RPE89339.1 hypothetical protein EDD67_0114 [Salisediminibacterium halotolerans]TWG36099.1 hypothetical protein BCL52_0999 [Salisediminibacterium halotolerans]GEL08023.1 hypothetical protein SHA02_14390 [Salisediminibacterium halotolerans]
MTDSELTKVMMHKLAKIDNQLASLEIVDDLIDTVNEQNDQIERMTQILQAMHIQMNMHHQENINSDDVLLRALIENPSNQHANQSSG